MALDHQVDARVQTDAADRDPHPGRAGHPLAGQQPTPARRHHAPPSSSSRDGRPSRAAGAARPAGRPGHARRTTSALKGYVSAGRAGGSGQSRSRRCRRPYAGADHRADRRRGRPRRRARSPPCTSRSVSDSDWTGCWRRIVELPRDDRWQTMARAALRDDLHTVHSQLVAEVMAATGGEGSAKEQVAGWEKATPAVAGLDPDAAADLRGQAGPGPGLGRAAGRAGPAARR